MIEFSGGVNREKFENFAALRANNFRMSKMMPVLVDSPSIVLSNLFNRLVSDQEVEFRRPRVATKLKEAFEAADMVKFVDFPEPVVIQEFGVSISAPFGYQNGSYNLIDAVNFGPSLEDAFKVASKQAISGQWLANTTMQRRKLIVVGNFDKRRPHLPFDAVEKMLQQHMVRLYSFDNLYPLFDDIQKNFLLHN